MDSGHDTDFAGAAARVIWERLIRSGRDALTKQNFALAVGAFASACAKAHESGDQVKIDEGCQWLSGTLLEFARLKGSVNAFNIVLNMMDIDLGLKITVIADILMGVADLFERKDRYGEAEQLYRALLTRTLRHRNEFSDSFCNRLQRQLFTCRVMQANSRPQLATFDWIG